MGNALIPVNQTTEEAYAFSFMGKAASYSAGVQNWSFILHLIFLMIPGILLLLTIVYKPMKEVFRMVAIMGRPETKDRFF